MSFMSTKSLRISLISGGRKTIQRKLPVPVNPRHLIIKLAPWLAWTCFPCNIGYLHWIYNFKILNVFLLIMTKFLRVFVFMADNTTTCSNNIWEFFVHCYCKFLPLLSWHAIVLNMVLQKMDFITWPFNFPTFNLQLKYF